MPKNRVILSIGVVIALLPVLGFPHSWESFFQILAGLSIVLLSVWAQIDKKIKLQNKAHQRQLRKATPDSTPSLAGVVPPVTEEFGKRITDFYPKTGQPGRRLADINPIIEPPRPAESEPSEPEI